MNRPYTASAASGSAPPLQKKARREVYRENAMEEIRKSLQPFEAQQSVAVLQRRLPPPIPSTGHAAILPGGGGLRVPPPPPSGAAEGAEAAGVAYLIGQLGLDEVRTPPPKVL